MLDQAHKVHQKKHIQEFGSIIRNGVNHTNIYMDYLEIVFSMPITDLKKKKRKEIKEKLEMLRDPGQSMNTKRVSNVTREGKKGG